MEKMETITRRFTFKIEKEEQQGVEAKSNLQRKDVGEKRKRMGKTQEMVHVLLACISSMSIIKHIDWWLSSNI